MSNSKEDALLHTERIANNFKKIYSPKQTNLQPIAGTDTYRYYLDKHIERGFNSYWESRVDKYINNEWKIFMTFSTWENSKCKELINRLDLGGNTVIKY